MTTEPFNPPLEHALTPAEFEAALRAKERCYHIHHPFHIMMNEGRCSPPQIQAWVANRYYYQVNIPIKDAHILSHCPDPATRRKWVQRILDHDGASADQSGGIEAWIRLGEAVGLDRETLCSQRLVLPAVRFAVDAYVNFAEHANWVEGACSSLTELFAPLAHQSRLDNWPQHYPWIDARGYEYFRSRLGQARRDVEHGLELALSHFTTAAQQQKMLNILQFKLDILWTILDALMLAYVHEQPPYFNISDQPLWNHQDLLR